jgi:hypothetical protein
MKPPLLAAAIVSIWGLVCAEDARASNDVSHRVRRFVTPGATPLASPTCSSPLLSYFGGPIVQSPVIVSVFWNGNVNATLQANIPQFFADVTHSTYWGWLQEYDTVPHNPGSAQAILPGGSGGAFTITPQMCAGSSACTLTDAQIQGELVRQIGLGVLPVPSTDCTGNVTTIYMVWFPPNVAIALGTVNSCTNGGFCAYHSAGTFNATTPLLYAALMDVFTGPCASGCGSNATALENATSVASHELAEAATDPKVGQGWTDNNNSCGEIADICEDGSPGSTITVGGRSWVVQQLWSNKQNACVSSGTVLPVCAGTALSGCRACSCGDNGNACGGAHPVCETATGNVLFGACEQCTASSATCASGKSCMQSSTPAQDDVCVALAPVPVPEWASGVGGAALLLIGVWRTRDHRTNRTRITDAPSTGLPSRSSAGVQRLVSAQRRAALPKP